MLTMHPTLLSHIPLISCIFCRFSFLFDLCTYTSVVSHLKLPRSLVVCREVVGH